MKRLMLILALAGCTEAVAEVETGDATEDTCNLAGAEALVGQNIAAVTLPADQGAIRVIGPDQAVTMDFSPSRLNIDHDKTGIITRVWCG
jgi:hypothetical protein